MEILKCNNSTTRFGDKFKWTISICIASYGRNSRKDKPHKYWLKQRDWGHPRWYVHRSHSPNNYSWSFLFVHKRASKKGSQIKTRDMEMLKLQGRREHILCPIKKCYYFTYEKTGKKERRMRYHSLKNATFCKERIIFLILKCSLLCN